TVALRGTDPDGITNVINGIAERFVLVAADLRREKLSELVKILGDQVRNAQLNLTPAEQTLRNFRVHSVTVLASSAAASRGVSSTQGRDTTAANFIDMPVSREEPRRDRTAMQLVLSGAGDSG